MAILRTLAQMAIQRFANDPELREKVRTKIKDEVIPKSQEGWRHIKPELDKIGVKGEILIKKLKNKIES